MQKEVVFHSIYRTLSIPLTPEISQIVGGQIITIPTKLAKFENHIFRTSEETEIKKLRGCPAYKRKDVFEVTAKDVEALRKPLEETQAVVRGPITTAEVMREKIEKKGKDTIVIEEKKSGITKCDVCGKSFENDFAGSRLRMHKISHRRKPKKKADKKK